MTTYAIPGLARAQAAYDAMEPPEPRECYCDRWQCDHCGTQYAEPGSCTDEDCAEERESPATLAELDDDYLWNGHALAKSDCPAHGGCQCGHDRCPECG